MPGRLIVGQEPIVLVVGAGGCFSDFFLSPVTSLLLHLLEMDWNTASKAIKPKTTNLFFLFLFPCYQCHNKTDTCTMMMLASLYLEEMVLG